jgi:1-acyl-sn-glycerol-3-phosphate acyltransferase
VMKKSTQYLPVIGWSMWFSEYVFLARNWSVDEKTLKVSTPSQCCDFVILLFSQGVITTNHHFGLGFRLHSLVCISEGQGG